MLNANPAAVQDEIDAIPAPTRDPIAMLGDPRVLAVDPLIVGDLAQMRQRLYQLETGIFAMAIQSGAETQSPPDMRERLQGMLAFVGSRSYQLILDLPDDIEKATRLFIHQLPAREADRMLVTALAIVQGHRLALADARIRELELDLQAARTDAPEVRL